MKYEIAAYYFPNYHSDPLNDKWHGKGWTEWNLVKNAAPRFEGHRQPLVPLWGYGDESDPTVMGKKIAAASEHGLTAFIFDWYWYFNGPYLNRALDEGFLGADNNAQMKFAVMWANHDWIDIHPAQRSITQGVNCLAQGAVTEREFVNATDYMINTYLKHPCYLEIDGGKYVSFYEPMKLIESFGMEGTKRLMSDFRFRAAKAGAGDLHLNVIIWGQQILPGEKELLEPNRLLNGMGFDSVSSYVWIHHHWPDTFPFTDYVKFAELNALDYEIFTARYKKPYFPNVSLGWDTSPRTIQSDGYEHLGYPFSPIINNNGPEHFEKALLRAKHFLDKSDLRTKMLTINAWNEWTEGNCLEPDTHYGCGYLEAVKRVFKSK